MRTNEIGGHAPVEGQRADAPSGVPEASASPHAAIIEQLVFLHRQRQFCIDIVAKLERSTEAMIRTVSGWRGDLPDAERKKLNTMATTARRALGIGLAPGIRVLVGFATLGCKPFGQRRKAIERDMQKLAKTLPAADWVASVKGFGMLAFAVVIAETGDLSLYATQERVWKRCGLAVLDGHRQGHVPAGVTGEARKAAWIAHGYVARRRAAMHAYIADPLLRAQWRGEKEIEGQEANGGLDASNGLPPEPSTPEVVPAHAIGPYGAVYGARKAHTAITHPEWHDDPKKHPGHADKDARRVMTKELLADLWRVWNGKAPRHGAEPADGPTDCCKPEVPCPSATSSDAAASERLRTRSTVPPSSEPLSGRGASDDVSAKQRVPPEPEPGPKRRKAAATSRLPEAAD